MADQAQRVVELECLAHGGVGERAGVREDGVARGVLAHIRVCVWGFGRAEEGEAHDVSGDCEAVFGVVEDGHAVRGFGQIRPFVHAHLEFGHVPAGVVVGGAPHDAELRFVGCLGVGDVDGEFDFEELHRLVPVGFGGDFERRGGGADGGGEGEGGCYAGLGGDGGFDGEGDFGGGGRGDVDFVGGEFLARGEMVHLYVPGLPVERLVVVDDELGGFGAFGDELALGSQVVEGGDGAVCDFDGELGVA